MAFPIAAVLGVASAGLSLFGSSSSASSARAAQRRAEQLQADKDEALYNRSVQEWNIDYEANLTSYAWDRAQVEQLRYNERLKNYDQTSYAAKLIKSATENLNINMGALADKYITQEGIRAYQEQSAYLFNQNKLSNDSLYQIGQFMGQINANAERTNQMSAKVDKDSQELVTSLAMKRQEEQLGWNLQQVTRMMEDSAVRASATTRTGGGQAANLAANNAMKALGRTYGLLEIMNNDKQRQIQLYNKTMNGEIASQFAQVALASKESLNGISNTVRSWKDGQQYAKENFENVTIPGFQQANNQYRRELESLWLKTSNAYDEASLPYREAQYFDPLRPIKGLKPEKYATGQTYSNSFSNTLGSVINGVQAGYSVYKQFGGDLSNLFGNKTQSDYSANFDWNSISGSTPSFSGDYSFGGADFSGGYGLDLGGSMNFGGSFL